MKITIDVPKTFLAAGFTMLYSGDDGGLKLYTYSITEDEVSDNKVLTLPKGEKKHAV